MKLKIIERILLKLVVIHFILLILIQIIHHYGALDYVHKLPLYEGVMNVEEGSAGQVYKGNK